MSRAGPESRWGCAGRVRPFGRTRIMIRRLLGRIALSALVFVGGFAWDVTRASGQPFYPGTISKARDEEGNVTGLHCFGITDAQLASLEFKAMPRLESITIGSPWVTRKALDHLSKGLPGLSNLVIIDSPVDGPELI